MTTEDILKRIDELIGLGKAALATEFVQLRRRFVNNGKFRGFRSASLSFLERIFGARHAYFNEFLEHVNENSPPYVEAGINILQSGHQ